MARPGFIFGAPGLPQTQEELQRLRDQAEMYYRPRAPQNVGEGLVALGDGLVTGILRNRAQSQIKAGQEGALTDFQRLMGSLGVGAPAAAPSAAPTVTAGLFSLPGGAPKTDVAPSGLLPPPRPEGASGPMPIAPLGGPIQLSGIAPNPDDRSIPAAIRHNNPGAMWPGPSSKRFGATGFQMLNDGLGQGNRIATFPTPEQGGAALFDLLNRRYTGKTLSDAIRKWSGGNHSDAYAARVASAIGATPDAVLTPDMLRDPTTALALAQAMAGHEAGRAFPMPDGGWDRAHQLFLAGGMGQPQAGALPGPPQPRELAPMPPPVEAAALLPMPPMPPMAAPGPAMAPAGPTPNARISDAFSIPQIQQYASGPATPMAAPPAASPMAGPGAPPADPAATAFLTGQVPPSMPAPAAPPMPLPPSPSSLPNLPPPPQVNLPPVATGVPEVDIPAPRMDDASFARAAALMNNPFLPPQQRAILTQQVQEEARRRDPNFAAELRKKAFEEEKLRRELQGAVSPAERAKLEMELYKLNPEYMTAAERARLVLDRDKFDYDRTKPRTDDIAEYEYARQNGFMGSFEQFMTQMKRAGATSITNTGERAFEKETGTALAKRFDALATDGDQAANDLEVLATLREQLLRVPTGFQAVMQQWAGSVGIKTEGSDAVETVHALISRLTPAQRVPGSGATSDFDAKMFRDSLPRLMNDPDGNNKILDVMEGLVQNRLMRADIATRVQMGDLTPKDALAELRALQAQARALSDQFKPASQRKGEAPAPAAPQGGGLTAEQLDEIRRKYGGGQ